MIIALVVMYLVFGLLWALFAFRVQKVMFPDAGVLRNVLGFAVNFIFAPVSMVVAIVYLPLPRV